MNRLLAIVVLAGCSAAWGKDESNWKESAAVAVEKGTRIADDPHVWFDARDIGLEGQGWKETKSPFGRLPAHGQAKTTSQVWGLGQNSAGVCVRFITDSPTIVARWTLATDRLSMPHMPATGVSGLDLYVHHEGRWKWLANGRPQGRSNKDVLASNLAKQKRLYLLYLPLYNTTESLSIGLADGAALFKVAPRDADQKPIVIYGTSITQGGCASRPGMAYPAILGRRLDRTVINLGFSGSAKMEPGMAELIAELDPAVFVFDPLPNLIAEGVAERTRPFIEIIRKKHPKTPIVMVENIEYQSAFLIKERRDAYQSKNAALRKEFDAIVAAGDKHISLVPGKPLLGDDSEATVDGTHPNDLGFQRLAEALEPAIKAVLKSE